MDSQVPDPTTADTVKLTPLSEAVRPGPRPVKALAGWLYTSNPFYAVSAALIFAGLRISFSSHGETSSPWGLAGGLSAYAMLLAASSYVLVRLGKVWDDVRSLLLLTVLVLIALSLSFDEYLIENFREGVLLNVASLAFAAGVSEFLLRGLSIRLPAIFRLPYYLLLAIFFVYPAVIARCHFEPGTDRLHWAFFGFPLAAALAMLALLPAARSGKSRTADNGTPWSWPWFPWPLFAVLGLCACGRAYSICVSLDFIGGSASAFGLYFLVPLCLAAALLFVEVGLQTPNRRATTIGMALAAAAPLLAASHRADVVYQGFLTAFHAALGGTPLFVTLCLVSLFYLLAAIRRVRLAVDCLTVCIALLSLVNRDALTVDWLSPPAVLPLFAAAAIQLAAAIVRSSSPRAFLAGVMGVLACTIQYRLTTPDVITIPMHLLLLAMLVTAVAFNDRFARFLRSVGAIAIGAVALWAVGDPRWLLGDWAAQCSWWYPLAWLAAAAAYGWMLNSRTYYHAAVLIALAWFGDHGLRLYQQLRVHVAGLDLLTGGMLFFAFGLLVSLSKAGVAVRAWVHRIPALLRAR